MLDTDMGWKGSGVHGTEEMALAHLTIFSHMQSHFDKDLLCESAQTAVQEKHEMLGSVFVLVAFTVFSI